MHFKHLVGHLPGGAMVQNPQRHREYELEANQVGHLRVYAT